MNRLSRQDRLVSHGLRQLAYLKVMRINARLGGDLVEGDQGRARPRHMENLALVPSQSFPVREPGSKTLEQTSKEHWESVVKEISALREIIQLIP